MRNRFAMVLALIVVFGLSANAWSRSSYNPYTPPPPPTPKINLPGPADTFQINFMANLNIGDSVINISNAGTQNGYHPDGNLCVGVYVFDPDEEMAACCSCMVTPNALMSLSGRSDLIANTLTGVIPTSITVKLLATLPVAGRCNAAYTTPTLAAGMRAWGTTLHALPTSPVTYGLTQSEFSPAVLSATELENLTTTCGFIQTTGSGFGICRSCRIGGL